MNHRNRFPAARAPRRIALALALAATVATAAAADVFDTPDTDFKGQVRPATPLVVPGTEVELAGSGFKPGQSVTLTRGDSVLGGKAQVADAEGKFSLKFALPADAAAGRHPIVVRADAPDAASVVELKVSPVVPLSGAERFDVASARLVQGLYQSAYSAKSDAVFVTSAVGRPPVTRSELLKVDPRTLQVVARATPAKVPGHDDGRVHAVYGVAVDDANGTVWVTNTREDTIAVYRQSDLSLVKQFDLGAVPHSRDVIVDAKRGKAYASATGETYLSVFDTRTLAFVKNLQIESKQRGGKFVPMSLELDEAGGKLFTVSLEAGEAAIIDTATDTVAGVIALPNAHTASGVAFDAARNRLLVASQGSDNLLVVDAADGKVLHDVAVGAGPLNVAFDAASGLAYVSNRGAGTVTVVDRDGAIVANLDGGTFPNHVHEDGKGHVFAVNKSRGEDDPNGDRITRIAPKAAR